MGIAVHGGIEFLIHTAQAQLDHHMQQPLAKGHHPQRALLLPNIINMFNETSRACAQEVLLSQPQFRSLLPYFELMCGEANHCYFRTPKGDLSSFLQAEGFPQEGDPPSSTASLNNSTLAHCTVPAYASPPRSQATTAKARTPPPPLS
jgi:hypothetical protein